MELKVIPIGNSKGVLLPRAMLSKLGTDRIQVEEIDGGYIFRQAGNVIPRSKWAAILSKMDCNPDDDFRDWDTTMSDGID